METQEFYELEAQFKKLMQTGLCSGGTLAWKTDDQVRCCSFGKEHNKLVYYDLASLTKVFVNIIALILIDRGILSLDLGIAKILDLKGRYTNTITLQHLLTYTVYFELGDFKINDKDTRYQDFIDRLKSADLKTEPGTEFYYTNLAPILLGMVLEKVTGTTMDQLVKNYLCNERYCFTFHPPVKQCVENFCIETGDWVRGIVHDYTGRKAWDQCGMRAMCAGLFATVNDIMNFSDDLMAGTILSHKMLDLMRKNHVGHIKRPDGTQREFGLGIDLEGRVVVANAYIGHQWRINFETRNSLLLMKNVTFSDSQYQPQHRVDSAETRHLFRNFVLASMCQQERKMV